MWRSGETLLRENHFKVRMCCAKSCVSTHALIADARRRSNSSFDKSETFENLMSLFSNALAIALLKVRSRRRNAERFILLKPKRGNSRPVSVRMATDALTMASRETASAIPWETWQRVDLLKGSRLVNRFSMIF